MVIDMVKKVKNRGPKTECHPEVSHGTDTHMFIHVIESYGPITSQYTLVCSQLVFICPIKI